MGELRRCLTLLEKQLYPVRRRCSRNSAFLFYPRLSWQQFRGESRTASLASDLATKLLNNEALSDGEEVLENEPGFPVLGFVSERQFRRPHAIKQWQDSNTFFITVRGLLQQGVATATIWAHVHESFFQKGRFLRPRVLDEQQRVVLLDVFHRVLEDWSQRDITPARVWPAQMIRCFNDCDLLTEKDWAFCLNSLARTTYESAFSNEGEALTYSPELDLLSLSLNVELFTAWSIFFHAHQLGTVHRTKTSLWSFLDVYTFPAGFRQNDPDFSTRFFSFAPKWRADIDGLLTRQMTTAVLMTLAACYHSCRMFTSRNSDYLPQSLAIPESTTTNLLTPPSPELPIGAPQSLVDLPEVRPAVASNHLAPNWHLGEDQQRYWTPSQSLFSQSEQSMLYITAQAANSSSINLTLLRITLAQMSVPRARIDEILQVFIGFRAAVPSLLQDHALALASQRYEREHPERRIRIYSRFNYLVQRSTSVRMIFQIWNDLCKIHDFSNIPSNLACTIHRKFQEADAVERAAEVWDRCPQIREMTECWTSRLECCLRARDSAFFENVWQELMSQEKVRPTLEHWEMRLRLYHITDQPVAALQHFASLLRLSGKNKRLSAKAIPEAERYLNSVSIDLFNMMIHHFLQRGMTNAAERVFELLEAQEDLAPNARTYGLLADFCEEHGDYEKAMQWLRQMYMPSSKSPTVLAPFIFLCSSFLVRYLHVWPFSRKWANSNMILDTITVILRLVLGEEFGEDASTRRKGALGSDDIPWDTDGTDESTSESSSSPERLQTGSRVTLPSFDLEDGTINTLARAYRFYCLTLDRLSEDLADPVNLRCLLIMWEHFRSTFHHDLLQKIPRSLREGSAIWKERSPAWLVEQLFKLPKQVQLRLLRGDLYQSPASPTYKNFGFVRNRFGPHFIVKWMAGVGIDESCQPSLFKLRWKGFDDFDDARLISKGIEQPEVRQAILEEMKKIRMQSEEAAESDRRAERLSPVIEDEEGLWFMDLAEESPEGSLRKVPFMTRKESRKARISVPRRSIMHLTRNKFPEISRQKRNQSEPFDGEAAPKPVVKPPPKEEKGPNVKIIEHFVMYPKKKTFATRQKTTEYVFRSLKPSG